MFIPKINQIYLYLSVVLYASAVNAGQISVINPSSGSSAAGIVASSPPINLDIGITGGMSGVNSLNDDKDILGSREKKLISILKQSDTSLFSTEEKRKIIKIIEKHIDKIYLNEIIVEVLKEQLQILKADLN